jgi:hypothetical protein
MKSKVGRPLKKDKLVPIMGFVPKQWVDTIGYLGKKINRSKSQIVRVAIQEYLEKNNYLNEGESI